jgi:C1A family cysteine protease
MMPGMGWIPDVPNVSDYDEAHPEVAPLLKKTKLAQAHSHANGGGRAGRSSGAAAATAPALAPAVDLRQYFSPIEDQGQLGSCTANAAVGLVEYYEKRASGRFLDASRLFVYKTTRNLVGATGDTGAEIRNAMGALVLFGAPPEKYWPYHVSKFDVEPTPFCYAFADNFKSIKYLRLDIVGVGGPALLDKIKTYLASNLPSMFGFPVYNEFMDPPANAKVAYPAPHSKFHGGHAIVAAGYDDNLPINANEKGALLIRNSWGTSWGEHGYAWLSYKYVTKGVALDWWTVVNQNWVDTGNFM